MRRLVVELAEDLNRVHRSADQAAYAAGTRTGTYDDHNFATTSSSQA